MNKLNNKKGFTILEILVAIAIFTLIIVVVSTFQSNVIIYNKYSSDYMQSAQDARSILRIVIRELRSAKPGNNGSYPIAQVSTSSITFYSDTNADGLQEKIRYFLSTTTLIKGYIKPTGSPLTYNSSQEVLSTLAYNIKNSTSTSMFEYFDNTYNGTSSAMTYPINLANIRLVKINLMIDSDPNRSPIPRLYTSEVMLRNLKDNL